MLSIHARALICEKIIYVLKLQTCTRAKASAHITRRDLSIEIIKSNMSHIFNAGSFSWILLFGKALHVLHSHYKCI